MRASRCSIPTTFSRSFWPGQSGVPPCDATGCDGQYGIGIRNRGEKHVSRSFPGPLRYELGQGYAINERYHLRFEADAFNIFNNPDFDTPNNDVDFFPYYEGPPSIPPQGSLGIIQHTIGSSRFMQLSLHFLF